MEILFNLETLCYQLSEDRAPSLTDIAQNLSAEFQTAAEQYDPENPPACMRVYRITLGRDDPARLRSAAGKWNDNIRSRFAGALCSLFHGTAIVPKDIALDTQTTYEVRRCAHEIDNDFYPLCRCGVLADFSGLHCVLSDTEEKDIAEHPENWGIALMDIR